jgi:hypothetical protein
MIFEMYFPFQDNFITNKIVGVRYIFVRFKLIEAILIDIPLKGIFIRVNLLLIL